MSNEKGVEAAKCCTPGRLELQSEDLLGGVFHMITSNSAQENH